MEKKWTAAVIPAMAHGSTDLWHAVGWCCRLLQCEHANRFEGLEVAKKP
jgi:hypothetical protein